MDVYFYSTAVLTASEHVPGVLPSLLHCFSTVAHQTEPTTAGKSRRVKQEHVWQHAWCNDESLEHAC